MSEDPQPTDRRVRVAIATRERFGWRLAGELWLEEGDPRLEAKPGMTARYQGQAWRVHRRTARTPCPTGGAQLTVELERYRDKPPARRYADAVDDQAVLQRVLGEIEDQCERLREQGLVPEPQRPDSARAALETLVAAVRGYVLTAPDEESMRAFRFERMVSAMALADEALR